MNWLLSLPGLFLRSPLSGWIAVAAVSAAGGLWFYIDNLRDKYFALQAECYKERSAELDQLGDQLKDAAREEFDKLRDALDNAEHPCLDWVYDPAQGLGTEDPTVRTPDEGE